MAKNEKFSLHLPVIGIVLRSCADWLQIKHILPFLCRSANKCSCEDRFPDICICAENLVDSEVFEKSRHGCISVHALLLDLKWDGGTASTDSGVDQYKMVTY